MVRHMPSSPYVRLRPGWRQKIREAMAERKPKPWTMRELSLEAGLGASLISEWLRDSPTKKPKEPSFNSLALVAEKLGLSMDVFVEGSLPTKQAGPALSAVSIASAQVVGSVQAGVWQEAAMIDFEDDAFVPLVQRSGYQGLKQYAWRVIGPSMNRIAPDGSYVIGVSVWDLDKEPPDNAPVVCVRHDGHKVEHTVKRVRYVNGGRQLVPDSTDPRFQEPIWIPEHGEPGETVEITHLVIGVYKEV